MSPIGTFKNEGLAIQALGAKTQELRDSHTWIPWARDYVVEFNPPREQVKAANYSGAGTLHFGHLEKS